MDYIWRSRDHKVKFPIGLDDKYIATRSLVLLLFVSGSFLMAGTSAYLQIINSILFSNSEFSRLLAHHIALYTLSYVIIVAIKPL